MNFTSNSITTSLPIEPTKDEGVVTSKVGKRGGGDTAMIIMHPQSTRAQYESLPEGSKVTVADGDFSGKIIGKILTFWLVKLTTQHSRSQF